MLILTYSNIYGTVSFYGGGSHSFLIKPGYTGFSLVERDYKALTFAEVDGQETTSGRAIPRAITIPVDIVDKSAKDKLKNAIKVLSKAGYLHIKDGYFERRIYCNQVKIPDPESLLRGEIASFVVQFVCDNPYFEDVNETVSVIYGRDKNITTPFTLPRAFALTRRGAEVKNEGDKEVEPKIVITCKETVETSGYISVDLASSEGNANLTINDYTPQEGDVITIDISERSITSERCGDLLNNLSDASFLSKFVLHPYPATNYISVTIENVTTDIGVECKYRNLYSEAIII